MCMTTPCAIMSPCSVACNHGYGHNHTADLLGLAEPSQVFMRCAIASSAGSVGSSTVAGLLASLKVVGYDMNLVAGSLPEIDVTQLRHNLRTHRDAVWQELHVSPALAPSANVRLCTYYRWFWPFAQAATILRLPISHTAMRPLLMVRIGCHGLAVDLGWGSGIARAEWSCAMCGAWTCRLYFRVYIACSALCGRTTWCSCPGLCVML